MSRTDVAELPDPVVPPAPAHKHVPALDGIRGLAVLLVLFCHATTINPGGAIGQAFLAASRLSFSGVDLFFVLSGFLITGILFDAKGSQNYFRNFYARRTVRIFPLYYAFLVFAFLIAPNLGKVSSYFGTPPDGQAFWWLYVSNFWQPFHHSEYMTFLTWSLAIEEQFYIAWPLVVFLLSRQTLMRTCAAMFFGSIALRVLLLSLPIPWDVKWSGANNFTFCRLDGLAAGACIALVARGNAGALAMMAKRARWIGPLAGFGILGVVGASFAMGWRGGIGQSPGYLLIGYSLCAVMYGSLLVCAMNAKSTSLMGRFFSNGLLTTFGRYSYAVYLLHIPINLLVMNLLFDPSVAGASPIKLIARQCVFYAITFPLSLAAAWVSWHVMEKHFLKLKDYFPMGGPKPTVTDADNTVPPRRAAA